MEIDKIGANNTMLSIIITHMSKQDSFNSCSSSFCHSEAKGKVYCRIKTEYLKEGFPVEERRHYGSVIKDSLSPSFTPHINLAFSCPARQALVYLYCMDEHAAGNLLHACTHRDGKAGAIVRSPR